MPKQLNCWVDDDMAAAVEAAAAQDHRSVSSWIRRLVYRELEPLDDTEPSDAEQAA